MKLFAASIVLLNNPAFWAYMALGSFIDVMGWDTNSAPKWLSAILLVGFVYFFFRDMKNWADPSFFPIREVDEP